MGSSKRLMSNPIHNGAFSKVSNTFETAIRLGDY